jgi:hypothetical protein
MRGGSHAQSTVGSLKKQEKESNYVHFVISVHEGLLYWNVVFLAPTVVILGKAGQDVPRT